MLDREPLRPILILGPGCSGTSAIADTLQRTQNVCFVHTEGVEDHGKPMMEDRGAKRDTEAMVWGAYGMTPKIWVRNLGLRHPRCGKVGVKNLWLGLLAQEQLNVINPLLVIETVRERGACVSSLERYGTKDPEAWYDQRVEQIQRLDWEPWASIEMDGDKRRYTPQELEHMAEGWMRMVKED